LLIGYWLSAIRAALLVSIRSPTPRSLIRRDHMWWRGNPEAGFGRAEVCEGGLSAVASSVMGSFGQSTAKADPFAVRKILTASIRGFFLALSLRVNSRPFAVRKIFGSVHSRFLPGPLPSTCPVSPAGSTVVRSAGTHGSRCPTSRLCNWREFRTSGPDRRLRMRSVHRQSDAVIS
jgi:hypothetical protein